MKLIFSDNTIWGLINFRQEVFRHFYEKGCEIVLVAPSDIQTQMKAKLPDFVKFIPIHLNRSGKNPLSDLKYLFSLYRIYRKEKPDWVFHYTIKPNIYGTLAASLLKIPNVSMLAGLGYAFSKRGFSNTIARQLYKFALHFAYKVFVLNIGNRDILLRDHIVQSDKLLLLEGGEGIDTSKILEGTSHIPGQKTRFLMVARVLYDKGYAEYIDAIKKLKLKGFDAEFFLMGPQDENYPNAVPNSVLQADIASGLFQYIPFTADPLRVMAKSGTVIVLPSYHEGLSRSLMEACALGKPIITSNVPGCRELVHDGLNGYVVPSHDSCALAQAMESYLKLSDSQKIQMGHEGRFWAVKRFDVKHVITVYESLIIDNQKIN